MIFRNHNNILLNKHFWLLSILNTVVLHNIFVETVIYFIFQDSQINRKFKRTNLTYPKHFTMVFTWSKMLLKQYFLSVFYLGLYQCVLCFNHWTVCLCVFQVGIVLHYSSLSTMLWLGVTARNIYKQVTKKPQQPPDGDQAPPHPARSPMLRYDPPSFTPGLWHGVDWR